jgi:hypothetical protein
MGNITASPVNIDTGTSVIFTAADWNEYKALYVYADDDFIEEPYRQTEYLSVFTVDASGGELDNRVHGVLNVTAIDDDIAGVLFDQPGGSGSVTTLTVREGMNATTATTYPIWLMSMPLFPVTVRPVPSHPEIVFEPATLVFAPAQWSTPQTVAVSALADGTAAQTRVRQRSVQHITTSNDTYYDPTAQFTDGPDVFVVDVEFGNATVMVASITPPASDAVAADMVEGSVADPADVAVFSVRLSIRPLGPVTVYPVSDPPDQVQATPSPVGVIFTAANYDVWQPLKISARPDATVDVQSPQLTVITVATASASDLSYDALPPLFGNVTAANAVAGAITGLGGSGGGGGGGGGAGAGGVTLAVNIIDTDKATLTLLTSPAPGATITVSENPQAAAAHSVPLAVSLSAIPDGPVTVAVAITPAGCGQASVLPGLVVLPSRSQLPAGTSPPGFTFAVQGLLDDIAEVPSQDLSCSVSVTVTTLSPSDSQAATAGTPLVFPVRVQDDATTPVISAVSPLSGSAATIAKITLHGSRFPTSGYEVRLGRVSDTLDEVSVSDEAGVPAEVLPCLATLLTSTTEAVCTLPDGSGRGWSPYLVSTSNPALHSGYRRGSAALRAATTFDYDPPTVSLVTAPVGPSAVSAAGLGSPDGFPITLHGSFGSLDAFPLSLPRVVVTALAPAVVSSSRCAPTWSAGSNITTQTGYLPSPAAPATVRTQLVCILPSGAGASGLAGLTVHLVHGASGVSYPGNATAWNDTEPLTMLRGTGSDASPVPAASPAVFGPAWGKGLAGLAHIVSVPVPFGFAPPIITAVSPLFSPATGGVSVTITGSELGTAALASAGDIEVTIAGIPCPITSATRLQIVCVSEPSDGHFGPAVVRVARGGDVFDLPDSAFSYVDTASEFCRRTSVRQFGEDQRIAGGFAWQFPIPRSADTSYSWPVDASLSPARATIADLDRCCLPTATSRGTHCGIRFTDIVTEERAATAGAISASAAAKNPSTVVLSAPFVSASAAELPRTALRVTIRGERFVHTGDPAPGVSVALSSGVCTEILFFNASTIVCALDNLGRNTVQGAVVNGVLTAVVTRLSDGAVSHYGGTTGTPVQVATVVGWHTAELHFADDIYATALVASWFNPCANQPNIGYKIEVATGSPNPGSNPLGLPYTTWTTVVDRSVAGGNVQACPRFGGDGDTTSFCIDYFPPQFLRAVRLSWDAAQAQRAGFLHEITLHGKAIKQADAIVTTTEATIAIGEPWSRASAIVLNTRNLLGTVLGADDTDTTELAIAITDALGNDITASLLPTAQLVVRPYVGTNGGFVLDDLDLANPRVGNFTITFSATVDGVEPCSLTLVVIPGAPASLNLITPGVDALTVPSALSAALPFPLEFELRDLSGVVVTNLSAVVTVTVVSGGVSLDPAFASVAPFVQSCKGEARGTVYFFAGVYYIF